MDRQPSPDLTALVHAIRDSPLRVVGVYAAGAGDPAQPAYVAVLEERPDDAAVVAIGALHRALRAAGTRLDGVWAVRSDLASPMALGRRWLTVAADGDDPVEDAAPNTALRRWVLRERGVAWLGPPPTDLVGPVGPGVIGAEALGLARTRGEEVEDDPALLDDAAARVRLVDELAVAWHAAGHGEVVTGARALAWCRDRLPAEAALGPRPGPADVRRFVWEAHARIGSLVTGTDRAD